MLHHKIRGEGFSAVQGEVDINYDLNYTNQPNCCQNIMGISTGGMVGTCPPDFGQGDAYTNAPPKAPTTGPNICIIWYILSHFLKKITRCASSIAFYKIYVPEIIEIWACNVKTTQKCIYLIGLTPKFRSLLCYYI